MKTPPKNLYHERRPIQGGGPISRDIAYHLYSRQAAGAAIVVTNKPLILLSTVRRQWYMLLDRVKVQQASTLDKAQKEALATQLDRMNNLKFGAHKTGGAQNADVYFVGLNDLNEVLAGPNKIHTLYVIDGDTQAIADYCKNSLWPNGLVITYGL